MLERIGGAWPHLLGALSRENEILAEALAIDGTPTLIVGDSIVRGAIPMADLAALIARARSGGS